MYLILRDWFMIIIIWIVRLGIVIWGKSLEASIAVDQI